MPAENNPILNLVRLIIFHQFSEFVIERPTKFGGNITYANYYDVERDFLKRKIHPLDLKKPLLCTSTESSNQFVITLVTGSQNSTIKENPVFVNRYSYRYHPLIYE